jgi:alcohol dehydrogenase (cytochrome c)/quinohemoprotein ethanol dehydrogenase
MRSITAGLWLALGVSGTLSVTAGAQGTNAIDDRALSRAQADGEWLTHGGDYAETRYSTLDEINADNVRQLALAWSVEVGSDTGRQESTPLVHDGILYATTTWNVLFAVDLRTQQLKWIWDPGVVRGQAAGGARYCCGPVNRGPALYGDKIYMGIIDGRLAALDAETGRVEWVVKTTPYDQNYSITGAPRVVKGKVIIGNGGGDYGARGYVTAYDAETGAQAWRFFIVPGDPALGFENAAMEKAAETWTGEWWELGGGGTAWDSFAYDPVADLLYIGTGNGGPWNRDKRSPDGGDNLYLSSIVAIDPDDGAYAWHYQTTPGESWDYTAVQQMVLADLEIDGELRPVIMQAPKNGFFYVIDRVTGEFISAEAYGRVNWASGVDANGRPIVHEAARYRDRPVVLYPWPRGAHNWHPMSFNPETGLMYIPGQERAFTYEADLDAMLGIAFGRGSGPSSAATVEPPSIGSIAPPGQPGFLVAWDPVTQEERWRVHFDTIENSGTLTTAGNLVFHGTQAGVFAAHDARTGDVLWETETLPTMGSPVTYTIDGRQYVSIMAGTDDNNPPGRLFTFALD